MVIDGDREMTVIGEWLEMRKANKCDDRKSITVGRASDGVHKSAVLLE